MVGYLMNLQSLVLGLLSVKLIQCGEPNLKERLDKIKFDDNTGPIRARIATEIP